LLDEYNGILRQLSTGGMDVYGDVVTDEARTASTKVAELAFLGNGAQAERNPR
jgi:hypothetical protein